MLAFAVPSELSHERIAAIATLANLQLDPSEVDMLARQLGEILAYADEIQRADTTGVPPTATVVTQASVDRDDDIRGSLDLQETFANAPDAALDAGLFRVPRVLG